jgi:hypothetical protein
MNNLKQKLNLNKSDDSWIPLSFSFLEKIFIPLYLNIDQTTKCLCTKIT